MTSTFAHVLESAEGNSHEVTTYVDKATPAGHFKLSATMLTMTR